MASGRLSGTARLLTSASSAVRLEHAEAFLRACAPDQDLLVVSSSRSAADDLARRVAASMPASFGWQRLSVLQLAARLGLPSLSAERRLPGSPLGAEAVAARAIFEAVASGQLGYFAPISHTPGFPRAVARTVAELRLAGVRTADVAPVAPSGPDLAALMSAIDVELGASGAADRAVLLRSATVALDTGARVAHDLVIGRPLVLLDPLVQSVADLAFLAALVGRADSALVTMPDGDPAAAELAARCAVAIEPVPRRADAGAIGRLQEHLFTTALAPRDEPHDEVRLLSAPGEGREAVEIARRVLMEAARGVAFDQMAILVRAPHQYLGLLEHALARAEVPAWFDRGTRRPDPAGRALLALLGCAEEGLSARRFAEYLSLAQVPDPLDAPLPAELLVPDDEAQSAGVFEAMAEPDAPPPLRLTADAMLAVVDGTLRAPWRWEALLVESAVIGGRDRWRRRLDGLEQEYRSRLAELSADEPEAPRAAALARDLDHLAHLRAFALPIVDQLDAWRESAVSWGDWLARLEQFAPRVLRYPTRVLRVLAELRPMSQVGPVGVGEVRKVLAERLRTLSIDPPRRRDGRVFVGSPDQARARSFRVVFVPGLAERVFPQKLREDPLLLDQLRKGLSADLADRDRRAVAERLQLRLAVGAATERLYLSYPRLDVSESRPRVPSFYALDVARALTGRIPSHEELQREAYDAGAAALGWPAPADPLQAIDLFEHDLAVLRPLFDERDPARVAGRARYLLELNACLGRSVRERWARHRPQWSDADGLARATPRVEAALASQRLAARPYSLSALQHYAACPYRFLLSAIYRLAPREDPVPLQRLDPLTKGSLFHRVQTECLRALRASGGLPVRPDTLDAALQTLQQTLARVAEDERARLAPAIARVWDDEMAALERDLARWMQLMAESTDGWVPQWFEYAFGLPDRRGHDQASRPDPVLVDGRFLLRGSMDMVERHPAGALRVTDHKTGRARWPDRMVVAGGEALQPLLYSLALEEATGLPVTEGRLWFCTSAGEFQERSVALTETTRRVGRQVLEIVDRAVEQAQLSPCPKTGACRWCEFTAVCGMREEQRTGRKTHPRFADLDALRAMP